MEINYARNIIATVIHRHLRVRVTFRALKKAHIIDLARKIHELARLTTWEFMNIHDSRPHNAVAEVV